MRPRKSNYEYYLECKKISKEYQQEASRFLALHLQEWVASNKEALFTVGAFGALIVAAVLVHA